jgi:peptidoglycan/xylan/chitin deacetylase (PgdA/CDA1 family)
METRMLRDLDHMDREGTRGEGDPLNISVLRYRGVGRGANGRRAGDEAPEIFRKHLELLDRWGFTTITLSDYGLFLRGDLHLPRRPVILTFDGLDLLAPLVPPLKEVGGRAMVFVATGSLHGATGEQTISRLREMQDAGIQVGSSTCSQRDLANLTVYERAEELLRSRETLEDLLGVAVDSCAYPFDVVNADVKRSALEAGYTFGLAGPRGPRLFGTDHLEIRREEIDQTAGVFNLALRAFTLTDRLMRLRTRALALVTRESTHRASGSLA